jgi:hypothetical protein
VISQVTAASGAGGAVESQQRAFAGPRLNIRTTERGLANPLDLTASGASHPRSVRAATPRAARLAPSREREFGRLKNEWALLLLRVRGIERVQLHADLTILAKLACALARARSVRLAA